MQRNTSTTYDVAVIGAGPAGQSAAELAAYLGHSAVIIERDKPGGVVTTTGGTPTKTLREAALYLTGFRQQEVYGVRAAIPLEEALPIIQSRTAKVCEIVQGVAAQQIATRGVTYVRGSARLAANRAIIVTLPDGSRTEITARVVLIATGSRPAHLGGIPCDDPDVYDSDRIYSIRRVPKDVVVAGGGPIGVEFATVFTALGIPVTLVNEADRLLPKMDHEIVDLMSKEFEHLGVKLISGARAEAISRIDGQLTVRLSNGELLSTDAVLVAAGRTPNTEGLGLEDAGVELDSRGRVVVDSYYRTTADGIYAVGDVVKTTLASVAMQQGRAAVCHGLGLVFGAYLDRASSSAVYGLPEVAGVGLTEEQAREAGISYVVGRGSYRGHRDEMFPAWKRDIEILAQCPNVAIKLGGLGSFAAGFPSYNAQPSVSSEALAAEWGPYIESSIEAFGIARCMFESNYPVDSGSGSYGTIWNAFKRITAGYSQYEKFSLFAGTANEMYRLKLRALEKEMTA